MYGFLTNQTIGIGNECLNINICKCFVSHKTAIMSRPNFLLIEVVDRGSETQLQWVKI